ncbi:fam126a [Linum perenne]
MSTDDSSSPAEAASSSSGGHLPSHSPSSSLSKIQSSIQTLSSIVPSIPPSLLTSENPALYLLHDPDVSATISSLLRDPNSGSGDNNLCRWLYDTFQSTDPQLQLVVVRFLPVIAGSYLSRVALRGKALAGFEAVLLALYAHETTSREGQSVTVNIPDISHPSIYHEPKLPPSKNNNATVLNIAVISPTLEPHGTVRSTRRARIVGVALELYYSKISQMPQDSKLEFCDFCDKWAGESSSSSTSDEKKKKKNGNDVVDNDDHNEGGGGGGGNKKIPLPWELMQPILRILGHCIMGPAKDTQLYEAACRACRSLNARSLHQMDAKAILATGSLLRVAQMAMDPKNNVDYTEIKFTDSITV